MGIIHLTLVHCRRETLQKVADVQMHSRMKTKKERIIELYDEGFDVESIADALATNPSYVANTLIAEGRPVEYEDLYTTTSGRLYSKEARRLAGVLRFKDIEAARESVRQLDEAYRQFGQEKNKRGQYRAQLLALIGKHRAEGIGKHREADLFREWLVKTLSEEQETEHREAA